MSFIMNFFQFALLFFITFLTVPTFGEAVCTAAKVDANAVSITHGYYLYPECVKAPESPKPQPKKVEQVIDLKASIKSFLKEEWRKEVGSTTWWKDRIEENPKRFKEVEKAFFTVWGKAPLEQQKLALALCLVETGCGFGEMRNWRVRGKKWTRHKRFFETHKFLSRAGACGITQVVPQVLGLKCANANASYLAAFKLQKRWLEEKWNDGTKGGPRIYLEDHKTWLTPIQRGGKTTYYPYRYNGGGKSAWRYGRKWKVAYDGIVLTKK